MKTTPYPMIKLNLIEAKKEVAFWSDKHREFAFDYLRVKAEEANEVKLTLVFGDNHSKGKTQIQIWGENGVILEYFVDLASPKEWEQFTEGFEDEWKSINTRRKVALSVRRTLKGEFQ